MLARACADDLGASCNLSISSDRSLLGNVRHQSEAGLRLKVRKWNFVHPWRKLSLNVANVVKEALLHYVPRWAKFKIVDCAKYLGFWLGPAASLKR